jgi:hypothetical protein
LATSADVSATGRQLILRLAECAKLAATAISGVALAALPDALVPDSSPDGLPRHIVGDLARVDVDRMNDPATAEAALRAGMVRLTIWDRDSARVESTCWSW